MPWKHIKRCTSGHSLLSQTLTWQGGAAVLNDQNILRNQCTKVAGQAGWILALARVCKSPRCQIEPNKECVCKHLKPSVGSY